jgi:hypothetical protein
MKDVAYRITGRPQITTDAHKPYLKAIEEAFGAEPIATMPNSTKSMVRQLRMNHGTALLPA